MKRSAAFLVALVPMFLAARPALALNVVDDKENERSLSVGVLLQTQLTLTQDGAPNGHNYSTDFFLRRVRAYTAGQITKGLTFFLQIDQPNLDKGGNFDAALFFRDAFMSYEVARELNIDAGLILWPFTHNSLEGAGSLHTIDYRNAGLPYPATEGKLFSDTGVQLRGLLLSDRLHYRVGAFEGARGPATTGLPAGTPPVNESGIPRFMGLLRLNILGVEDKFFFQGIYFSDKPLISVGVGADFQPHALRAPAGGISDYAAVNGDVFVEYPFSENDEILFNTTVANWHEGTGSTSTGTSAFGELGYRHRWIEPLVAVDWFKADQGLLDYVAVRPGVNFWLKKHNGNIKAEAAWSSATRPTTGIDREFVVTVQGQVFF